MKKDRDVVTPYPIYQPFQNINPAPYMGNMMPMLQPNYMNNSCNNDNSVEQKLNNLEKRVNLLENMLTNYNQFNNNYNSSNYQML